MTTDHTQKMKNVDSKKCQSNVKIKKKIKASPNAEFINEVFSIFQSLK
jgi:hypothetical protein